MTKLTLNEPAMIIFEYMCGVSCHLGINYFLISSKLFMTRYIMVNKAPLEDKREIRA